MVKEYEEIFVTIQDDVTVDDLAYMKLINYNQKVVVNNMMAGFLGSQMAHFLGSVHPYGLHYLSLAARGVAVQRPEKDKRGLGPLAH